MVRYTGRQKTITGAVNRNQVGLKMSGCPSRVGRSGKNLRLLGRRVNCMYGLCGPTMVNGAPWRTSGRNKPPYCRQRSTACAQAAGGVGTNHNIPYYRTPKKGESGCTPAAVDVHPITAAVRLLQTYLTAKYGGAGSLILVAKKETLTSDHVEHPEKFDQVKHFYSGSLDYLTLPAGERRAADLINSLRIPRQLKEDGPLVAHVVGYESFVGQQAMMEKVYGTGPPITFGPLQSDRVNIFGIGCGLEGSYPCWELHPFEAYGTCTACDSDTDLTFWRCAYAPDGLPGCSPGISVSWSDDTLSHCQNAFSADGTGYGAGAEEFGNGNPITGWWSKKLCTPVMWN